MSGDGKARRYMRKDGDERTVETRLSRIVRTQFRTHARELVVVAAVLVVWAAAETAGVLNLVTVRLPYSPGEIADVLVGTLSLLLTFILVSIYQRQTEILRNQEKLMEKEYQPLIRADIDVIDDSIVFLIENTGREAAVDLTAKWELGESADSWRSPFLSSGRDYWVPVTITDDRGYEEPLTVDHLEPLLASEELSVLHQRGAEVEPYLSWTVDCRDIVGNEYSFGGTIDLVDAFDRIRRVSSSTSEAEVMRRTNGILDDIETELEAMNSDLY
jgi:hypothetical protein